MFRAPIRPGLPDNICFEYYRHSLENHPANIEIYKLLVHTFYYPDHLSIYGHISNNHVLYQILPTYV